MNTSTPIQAARPATPLRSLYDAIGAFTESAQAFARGALRRIVRLFGGPSSLAALAQQMKIARMERLEERRKERERRARQRAQRGRLAQRGHRRQYLPGSGARA